MDPEIWISYNLSHVMKYYSSFDFFHQFKNVKKKKNPELTIWAKTGGKLSVLTPGRRSHKVLRGIANDGPCSIGSKNTLLGFKKGVSPCPHFHKSSCGGHHWISTVCLFLPFKSLPFPDFLQSGRAPGLVLAKVLTGQWQRICFQGEDLRGTLSSPCDDCRGGARRFCSLDRWASTQRMASLESFPESWRDLEWSKTNFWWATATEFAGRGEVVVFIIA